MHLALRGHVEEHHRFLLEMLLNDIEHIEANVARLEEEIERRLAGHQDVIRRLCTIPGVDRITAWTLIAELGLDMSVFETAQHAASWAGLCPGNRESAGKRLSNRTRKGNRWLRRGLCQSAWAVTHKKDCYLTSFFYRRAGRQGVRKAIVSTAHQILIVAYCILRDGAEYRERGGAFFDLRHPERTRRRLQARLDRLTEAEQHLKHSNDYPQSLQ